MLARSYSIQVSSIGYRILHFMVILYHTEYFLKLSKILGECHMEKDCVE